MNDFDAASVADTRAPKLEVQNGPLSGAVFVLAGEETLIGRKPGNDLALDDEGISREHAIVLRDLATGEASIEDLQSTNGTKVNGKRIRSAVLSPGDEIQIGHTRLRFAVADA